MPANGPRISILPAYLPVRRVQAQLTALVHAGDVLVHRVDRLQNATGQPLEFAQLVRLLGAVVLQIVDACVPKRECARASVCCCVMC